MRSDWGPRSTVRLACEWLCECSEGYCVALLPRWGLYAVDHRCTPLDTCPSNGQFAPNHDPRCPTDTAKTLLSAPSFGFQVPLLAASSRSHGRCGKVTNFSERDSGCIYQGGRGEEGVPGVLKARQGVDAGRLNASANKSPSVASQRAGYS